MAEAPADVPAPARARLRYPAERRLRDSASFALFTRGGQAQATGRWWRGGRRWLAVAALITPYSAAGDARPRSRFGVTVGKRNARRSIDRSLVKRVLREAARHAAPAMDAAALAAEVQLDVVLRLKAPMPPTETLSRAQFKRALREEADGLLARLARELATPAQ